MVFTTVKKIIKNSLPDSLFLKIYFRKCLGYSLNLKSPRTFNEKLQWLKLNDRNPLYTSLVDKYQVKQYISEKIGKQYVIPTLGVWEHFDDIKFDSLPNSFVLKCTHDSGGIVFVKNKNDFVCEKAKEKLEYSLKNNFYYVGREWPYKNVKPRIIAEPYMAMDSDAGCNDYKLMCFNGKVKCTFVCSERYSADGLKVTFFDQYWNVMPFERHYPKSTMAIEKPQNYNKMVELAETLAEAIPFVRVDFYEIKGQVFFGELTFYPGNGFEEFKPVEWDERLGDWLILR